MCCVSSPGISLFYATVLARETFAIGVVWENIAWAAIFAFVARAPCWVSFIGITLAARFFGITWAVAVVHMIVTRAAIEFSVAGWFGAVTVGRESVPLAALNLRVAAWPIAAELYGVAWAIHVERIMRYGLMSFATTVAAFL
jgi:hypothetical protein